MTYRELWASAPLEVRCAAMGAALVVASMLLVALSPEACTHWGVTP